MRCGALRGLVEQFGDVREALAQAGHGPARQVRVGEHGTDPQRLRVRVLGTTEEILEVPGERGETPTDPQLDVSDVELTIRGQVHDPHPLAVVLFGERVPREGSPSR